MTDDISELEQENNLVRARNARLEAEVTVLTEMVRVLSAKIAELEALAQPEQEPVAWMTEDECEVYTSKQVDGYFQHDHIPLYTTPPQRKPLTKEQRYNILREWNRQWTTDQGDLLIDLVEAAHGIKE